MIGADDNIYWMKLTREELRNDEPFSKVVRIGAFFSISLTSMIIVQRNADKIFFKDDFNEYELSLTSGELKLQPYQTEWVQNVVIFNMLSHIMVN